MPKIKIRQDEVFKLSLIGWAVLFLSGCVIVPNTPSESTVITPTQEVSTSPTEGAMTQMPSSLPTPVDPAVQTLIEKAKEDLAQRLSISLTQIQLVQITEVEWSDSSLGCPQSGMDYLQVITPGYLILLDVNAQTYEYHSNRDTYFVYCENQSPPIIPKP